MALGGAARHNLHEIEPGLIPRLNRYENVRGGGDCEDQMRRRITEADQNNEQPSAYKCAGHIRTGQGCGTQAACPVRTRGSKSIKYRREIQVLKPRFWRRDLICLDRMKQWVFSELAL